MMAFGSYLPKHVSIPRSALIIVLADTLVAVVAGLVIFPAVFSNGLDPAAGPGLIFQTLPVAFAQMPGGRFFGILFFLLLAVAGITSMVGLVECLVCWIEDRYEVSRHRAAWQVMSVIALLSILSVLSYNLLAEFRVTGRDLNALLDYVSNQLLLPLGGLLIAVFAGWALSRSTTGEELAFAGTRWFGIWHFLIRYLVPPAVLIIFVLGISA